MGIIAASTLGLQKSCVIPRKNLSGVKLSEMTQVPLIEYRFSTFARQNVKFDALPLFQCVSIVDLLWELSFCSHQQIPNWQGIMYILHSECEYPGLSSVHFLPMIDMYPGDPTCILSTLTYICDLAQKQNIWPIITFDQPLF